jgi:hypothetical protein
MLRPSDIPLAAVDGHVTQGVMSALLGDDAIFSGLEDLGSEEEFSGEDPQQILSQLMCAHAILRMEHKHGMNLIIYLVFMCYRKCPSSWPHN